MRPGAFIAAVLSLTFLLGCDALDPSGDTAEDKDDNNNTIATAQDFPFDTPVAIKLDNSDDVDYLRFTLDTAAVTIISLDDMPNSIDIYAYVVDHEGTTLRNPPTFNGGSDWFSFKGNAGEYYLKLSPGWSTTSPEAFTVTIRVDTLDRHESNDDISTATDAELDKTYRGAIFPTQDYDYYRLSLSEPRIVRVVVDSVSRKVRPYLYFYDIEGTLTTSKLFSSDIDHIEYGISLESGTHYVSLHGNYDEWSRQPYYIRFESDTMDPTEWNDDTTHAYRLELGEAVYGAIYPYGDHDYYRFELQKPDTVAISVDSVSSKVRLYVSLLDAEATEITYSYKAAGEDSSIRRHLEQGVYFVVISDNWDDAISGRRHRLLVSRD